MSSKRFKNIILISILVLTLIIVVLLLRKKSEKSVLVEEWYAKGAAEMVDIEYPQDNTMFPPEFACPTFIWSDTNSAVNQWLVQIKIQGEGELVSVFVDERKWKPERGLWEEIKRNTKARKAFFTVLGVNATNDNKLITGNSVTFETSVDSVGAPIFYRDVILPVRLAREHLDSIKWRICDISSDEMAHVALENLPVCGNCHTFSQDGKTFGMDVDASMDKGAFTMKDLNSEIEITNDDILTWTDLSRDPCLGLLSKISPDGRYAVTTIDDNSVLMNREDPMYSQFFFPIRGELAIYDKLKDTMYRLPGASDTAWCQSNPNWSPDGKYILFTRAKAIPASESGITDGFKRDETINKEFTDQFVNGSRPYKYDLYRIPFNDGAGGIAEPVPGASGNGRSNYFARFSPDGKWVVFCQADNFMLLMGDSKLFIMPSSGGEVRELECNLTNMNSYHSWSPNSKWIAVATKNRGPYTQMYLTHIDEDGHASPAVFVENATPPGRAVNIPEFVNIPLHSTIDIVDKFTETGDYLTISEAKYRASIGEFNEALKAINKAIKFEPNNYDYYFIRAYILSMMNDFKGAIADYDVIIKAMPNNREAYHNRGLAYNKIKNYKRSTIDFSSSINLKQDDTSEYYNRALALVALEDYHGALKDFDKVLTLDPKDTNAYYNRALTRTALKEREGAISDLETAVKLAPTNTMLLNALADLYLLDRRPDEAETLLNTSIKADPQNIPAHNSRGEARLSMNKPEEALNDFEIVLSLEPENFKAITGCAKAYIKQEKYSDALENLNRAKLITANAIVFSLIGDVELGSGNYQEAIKNYDEALKMNPRDSRALYNRGKCKMELGYADEACTDLNQAFKLGYIEAIKLIQKNCVKK